MNVQSFLGPMTMMTAAGVQPMGSVFSTVPSSAYLLGQDMPRILPPVRTRLAPVLTNRDHHMAFNAQPCGCGA